MHRPLHSTAHGFTLIELSIVLVIIGLIVGGVLVGRDLIIAATVRAQISQIEKFQTAANVFRGKYVYLPGDIPDPDATRFGFVLRGVGGGQGDGNWVLEGYDGAGPNGQYAGNGETAMFWVDLTYANGMNLNLINGNFRMAATSGSPPNTFGGSALDAYAPKAVLGSNNHVYIWSYNSVNYYCLSNLLTIQQDQNPMIEADGIKVREAYSVDKKMDDGLANEGITTARHATDVFAGTGGFSPNAATDDPTTCFNSTTGAYSLSQNNGMGVNCSLSFKLK